jgi:hypothetical protein
MHETDQRAPTALECAELPPLNMYRAIGFLDKRAGCNLRQMHIESGDARVQCHQFHHTAIPVKLRDGRWRMQELNMPEDDKSSTACLTCVLDGSNSGTSQFGGSR